MASMVADSVDEKGNANRFVIGMQAFYPKLLKIPTINRGISPVKSEDPEVAILLKRSVLERKNMTVTFTYDALRLADVVVVISNAIIEKTSLGM